MRGIFPFHGVTCDCIVVPVGVCTARDSLDFHHLTKNLSHTEKKRWRIRTYTGQRLGFRVPSWHFLNPILGKLHHAITCEIAGTVVDVFGAGWVSFTVARVRPRNYINIHNNRGRRTGMENSIVHAWHCARSVCPPATFQARGFGLAPVDPQAFVSGTHTLHVRTSTLRIWQHGSCQHMKMRISLMSVYFDKTKNPRQHSDPVFVFFQHPEQTWSHLQKIWLHGAGQFVSLGRLTASGGTKHPAEVNFHDGKNGISISACHKGTQLKILWKNRAVD